MYKRKRTPKNINLYVSDVISLQGKLGKYQVCVIVFYVSFSYSNQCFVSVSATSNHDETLKVYRYL